MYKYKLNFKFKKHFIVITTALTVFLIIYLCFRFASPKVMSVCITLLSTFEKNSAFTNHCITKMLHRIAWDCKLPSMLFQASLFRKFQQIMESMDPSHKVSLTSYFENLNFHNLLSYL